MSQTSRNGGTELASGVVLAGGSSSRFGSDKLSTAYLGMPLLHHAVLRLAEVCSEVLVVIAPEGAPPPLPAGAHVRIVRDAASGQGPLAGLAAGLANVHTEWSLVAGGDMPELAPAVLRELLRAGLEARADIAVLQDGDRFRPLPAAMRVMPARAAAAALLGAGERRLRSLMEELPGAMIDEATWTPLDPGRRTLFDVDQPGDLPPEDLPPTT